MDNGKSESAERISKVYIETFGCQMNKSDSEHMLGLLEEIGYRQTNNIKEADLMVLNTCAIREGAEDKVYSYLGVWRRIKEQRDGALIAVGGCVAQDAGSDLLNRADGIDVVFGTHNLHHLPDLILQTKRTGKPVVEILSQLPPELPDTPVVRQSPYAAWVSIIYGCDYNCTYCIVPYVRGRERSRTPEDVYKEVAQLAEEGYLEVTLLGQNVTAYGHDLDPAIHLGDLFRKLGDISDIKRIRFLTGHPRDLNTGIIEAAAQVPSVCEYFHIPIQAGDDRTLQRMARGYQVDFYRKQIEKVRNVIPEAAISTDLIVGFPGETEAEFMNTISLVEEIGFDACITAAYSPRPHTPSANWEGQLPETEKHERLRFLNSVVNDVAGRCNQKYLGRKVEVLVEGLSQRNPARLTGRTRTNKVVNFDAPKELIGKLVDITISSVNPWALRGQMNKFYTNLLFQLLLCVLLPGTVPVTHIEKISDVLYRGSDPTKKQMQHLKAMGIKTLISCRTNPEKSKAKYARSIGMNFFHIPTGVFITPGTKEVNQFLTIVHNPANQPAYISCVIGTDRTSVYVASYRVVDQHYTYAQAREDMKKNHLKPWWYSFRRYKYVAREYADNPELAKSTEFHGDASNPATDVASSSSATKSNSAVPNDVATGNSTP
jgi:tRNA-2-methylthio-N6-dimethylallyladenosine synthase